MAETQEPKRRRKVREGTVVSRSGRKSVVVEVEMRRPHPRYGKVIRLRRRWHAHDEKEEAVVGDRVRIEESRPLSRLKRWRVVAVIRRPTAETTGTS